MTNQVKTELCGSQFSAPCVPPASANAATFQHSADYKYTHVHDSILFFTFYLHLQKLGLHITFALNFTFCAFLYCKVLTAQAAFGAKMKGFIINITLCVCIENGPFLVFPEGTLFWLYCDTSLWHCNEGKPCFTCHGEKCHKMLTYLLKVARNHFHWAMFSHLQSSEM